MIIKYTKPKPKPKPKPAKPKPTKPAKPAKIAKPAKPAKPQPQLNSKSVFSTYYNISKPKPKLSIIMPYYNRQEQLNFTLKTIALSEFAKDIEIIIVDDGSHIREKAKNIVINHKNLYIKLLEVKPEDKWWRNPCIANNIAIKESSAPILLLQSPEVFHVGDVIKYVIENINDNRYILFKCFYLYSNIGEIIRKNYSEKSIGNLDEFRDNILKYLRLDNQTNKRIGFKSTGKWMRQRYNFLSAMTRKDMDDLGGFDERFALGYGNDDVEFLHRINLKKMSIKKIKSTIAFGVHQKHRVSYDRNKQLLKSNNKLLLYAEKSRTQYQHKVDNQYRNIRWRCISF